MNSWISSWQQFLLEHPPLQIKYPSEPLQIPKVSSDELASNELFWQEVKNRYPQPDRYINLNSGAVSSSPHIVEKAFTGYYTLANRIPSYYIFRYMEQGRELIRQGLAGLINSSPEEVTILRNTTEALNNLIFGIQLEAGDEVVACKQDYSKAISSWKQRELRDHIKTKWISLDGPAETDEEIIAKFVGAFTEKTKVLHLTHVINWNGQILPVKKLIQEAKKRNIAVLLDAAHSFGLLETDVKALGCDYFVTALHKWLSGPIPSALMYIQKDKIHDVWPLASSTTPASDNIRKFEELSIQLMPAIIALGFAIEFYLQLGRNNKEQRLRYLRNYWVSQLQELNSFHFHTPIQAEERCCVIVNIALNGWEPVALDKHLLEQYNIHVTAVTWENMQGIRVTPNVYTTLEELQLMVHALQQTSRERS
ncbi:aminotransferase class V-fold PLP-dependent enzyme [Rhodocytophaga rosea]|uniref:Aminotransferase class V-fold PLP-dependent enzyme n=1 Tax=Rhodocytophaga rosea TaxID=2704465 RepID=A0A6C0GCJ3_9BACT|nr:aminotransferase class V-fold PLP-dependent enzyme [Rhodocytophaga rosea]QHT65598.1 aminotransferase class V-fold PLP-dependent enzyme [Rhodocytophaga rosea]